MLKKAQTEQELYNELKAYITVNKGNFINLGQLLSFAAQRFPSNNVLISGQQKITYRELFYRASLFAQTLKKKGVKPRDRILLFF